MTSFSFLDAALLVSSIRTMCLAIEPEYLFLFFDKRVLILHFVYRSVMYFELVSRKVGPGGGGSLFCLWTSRCSSTTR